MIHKSVVIAGLFGTLMCAAQAPSRISPQETLVFEESRSDWFHGYLASVALSQDAAWALVGHGSGNIHLFSLPAGREEDQKLNGGFDGPENVAFCGGGTPGLAMLGRRGSEHGWSLPGSESGQVSNLPVDATLACSPDGRKIAYFVPSARDHGLHVGSFGHYRTYSPPGSVTAMTFSTNGDLFYYLALDTKGQSTLSRISVATGETRVVASQLDGSLYGGQIALSPDGKSAYISLASDKVPNDMERQQPHANRWLKIYKMDLSTGALQSVVDTPGYDNTGPAISNGNLYWTRDLIHDSIVTLPSRGGAVQELTEGGLMPIWHPSGTKIGYFFGDFRLADMALDLDDAEVGVDREGARTSTPSVIVSGYHEDFPPDWSPDGKWIAFHSHRSPGPVSGYLGAGSTDDVYLRRADDLHAPERRLTNFGLETGAPFWSPDGRKLLMVSEQRGGTPGISKVWILTMNAQEGTLLKTELLPLPNEIRSVTWAMWSPNGAEIAIEDDRASGKESLWIVRADGSHATKVVDYEGTGFQGLDWSRDGKSIVYSGLAGDRLQLFSVARTGGTAQQLTHDSANLMHPRFSPDGSRIACTRETQVKQIWRRPLP